MAAITSAIIAGVSAAYSIGSAEEQKKDIRKKGQKAEREAKDFKDEADEKEKTDAARKSAKKQTQTRLSTQRNKQVAAGGKAGNVLGGAPGGDSSSKSLLGV